MRPDVQIRPVVGRRSRRHQVGRLRDLEESLVGREQRLSFRYHEGFRCGLRKPEHARILTGRLSQYGEDSIGDPVSRGDVERHAQRAAGRDVPPRRSHGLDGVDVVVEPQGRHR